MLYFVKIHVFLCVVSLVLSKRHNKKDGKLVLNPIELVDLLWKEKSMTGQNTISAKNADLESDSYSEVITTEEECQDEDILKARKVWSRWGKWGECSVTCGKGTLTRQRVCVGGRCAPGEHEEQRRPCARAPCQEFILDSSADDIHEAE